ncbi:MAG: hypothetical protein RMK49_15315 [Abditibacteriales bacterium]|nr:hypothetical protein [Abditibacteriales bacterium]
MERSTCQRANVQRANVPTGLNMRVIYLGFFVLCLMLLGVSGCSGGRLGGFVAPPAPGLDLTPPEVQDQRVRPATFRINGGQVTIRARVSDPSGVADVNALVSKPDGTTDLVPLALQRSDIYQATYNVADNVQAGAPPAIYIVRLRARDNANNEIPLPGVLVGTVTVEAPFGPPAPPSS